MVIFIKTIYCSPNIETKTKNRHSFTSLLSQYLIMLQPITSIVALFMIHGTHASCDGVSAKQLTNEIDQFNVLLGNFAELGSSVLKASATSTHKSTKPTGRMIARDVSRIATNKRPVTHSHMDLNSESQKPSLHHQIQKSYHKLSEQQSKLNALQVSCVPIEHKLHIASQLTNMMSTYVTKDKQIKAAGKHIEEEKSSKKGESTQKQKRSPEEKERRREERRLRRRELVKRSVARETHDIQQEKHAAEPTHQQAAWLTMDDGINGGYNDDQDMLTATSTTSSTTALSTSVPYYTPYAYNSPQLEPQYITITSSGSIEVSVSPTSLTTHKEAGNPSDNDSTSGSDTSSDDNSSDDENTSTVPHTNNVSLPTPTSAHHNIIVRTFDGTLHLITGSLHLVDDLFHKIFIVEDIENSESTKKDVVNDKEINSLISHAKEIYHVKL